MAIIAKPKPTAPPKIDTFDGIPYPPACLIETTWENGKTSIGSGVIWGPNMVLTVAHNLYSHVVPMAPGDPVPPDPSDPASSRLGIGWAKSIRVTPGIHGTVAPFGRYTIRNPRQMDVAPEWLGTSQKDADQNDFGVIFLPSIGLKTSWSDIGFWDVDPMDGQPLTGCGYFFGGRTVQHVQKGRVTQPRRDYQQSDGAYTLFAYTVNDSPGFSGAPLWIEREDRYIKIVALHKASSSPKSGIGLALTQVHYNLMQAWSTALKPLSLLSGKETASTRVSHTAESDHQPKAGTRRERVSRDRTTPRTTVVPKALVALFERVKAGKHMITIDGHPLPARSTAQQGAEVVAACGRGLAKELTSTVKDAERRAALIKACWENPLTNPSHHGRTLDPDYGIHFVVNIDTKGGVVDYPRSVRCKDKNCPENAFNRK